MKRESWSILIACGLGALIGYFVACDISTRFEFGSHVGTFGTLIGGLVAYFAVDFREFCTGVARSYKKTIAWKPDRIWWKNYALFFGATNVLAMTFWTAMIGMGVAKHDPIMPAFVSELLRYWVLIAWPILGVVVAGHMDDRDVGMSDETYSAVTQKDRQKALAVMLHGNPISICGWAVIFAVRSMFALARLLIDGAKATPATIVFLMRATWNAIRSIGKFFVWTFIYVHSSRRTLCFVDATLGAATGYLCGSAIIGTVTGALLGVVNYELVSVRWLKLVPVRAT